jgi:uncharacterized protein (TIGR00730 family)
MIQHQPVVCIFCASSTQVPQCYFDAATELAHQLITNGYAIKYGGGAVGLMGAIANKVLELKGRIIGVIPEFMVEVEWQHPQVEEMQVVTSMHERKKLLVENVDAVIALPGSSGTLEELIEVISMKKLGLFNRPVIIVNTNGFYDTLIEFFNRMVNENFLRQEHLDTFTVVSHPHQVIEAIRQAARYNDKAIQLASI